ncbi:hypothetical protein C8R47DRAFT_913701, partial [Mycena vitilis]
LRHSKLQGLHIPETNRRLLVSLFADETTIYLSTNDSWLELWRILDLWCTASTTKFNRAKTLILPFGSPGYRQRVLQRRTLNDSRPEDRIRDDIKIVREGETCRILGAWLGNQAEYVTPWPEVLDKIATDLARWDVKNPLLEGRRHIINMVVGGRTQYLTRVQGMPKRIEDRLVRMQNAFLWSGKTPRIAQDTMHSPLEHGGKQILDIRARNEAIDLWNLKEYLKLNEDRSDWTFFVDQMLKRRLEKSSLKTQTGEVRNIFLQNIRVPTFRTNPLPNDVQRMIITARKYNITFTALSIADHVQLEMPVWRH